MKLGLIIFLSSVLTSLAASYYVTQSGGGSHDGTSSANAWSVSEFNASAKPTGGDVVNFSGTLTAQVTPATSGTSSGAPLTLKGGTTSMTSGTAIRIDSKKFITVDGWTFNCSDINAWPTFVYSSYSSNLTYSNCKITNCGYGFLGANDSNVLITGCDVLSSKNGTNNIGNQTDLVHGGGWQNVVIEKSRFISRAPGNAAGGSDGSYRHNDLTQTFATGGSNAQSPTNWTIRYNWYEDDNTSPPSDGHNSMLMIEAQGGYFKIYDNVFVCPDNAGGINNGVHMGSGKAVSDQHVFYNNTVVKKRNAPGAAISYNDANKPDNSGNGTLYCANNIAYCSLTGSGQGSTANNLKVGSISNNFWFNFSNAPSKVAGIPPGPGGSSTTDPKFKDYANNDFSLASNSPCIGAGTNLGSEYALGLAPGATWPNPTLVTRSGSWDVGAYVASAGPAPSPTPSPAPTPSPSATPTPSPSPSPSPSNKFAIGDSVTPMETVNVRQSPAGNLLGTHSVDEVGVVQSGPVVANFNGAPVIWYEIKWQSDPLLGWTGDDKLAEVSPPTPTPSPTPTPTPTPGPSPSPTPCPSFTTWDGALHVELSNCPSQADLDAWLKANPPYPDPATRERGSN